MPHTRDLNEVAVIGECSQPKYYSIEHNHVDIEELVRLTEELEGTADNENRDLRNPIDLEKIS